MARRRGWAAGLLPALIIGAGCAPPPGASLTTPFDTTKLAATVTVVYQRTFHISGTGGAVETYAATPGVGTSGATPAQRDQAEEFESRLGYGVTDSLAANTISTTTATGAPLATIVDPMFPIPSSTPTGYWIYGLRWSPDGAHLAITRVFEIIAGGFIANTTVYDPLTGARLGSTFDGRDFAWRHDSTGVAFPAGADVRTMALTPGAAAVTVATVGPGECSRPRDWSVDERLLFLCQVGSDPSVRTLSTMDATGGPRRVLDTGDPGSTPIWLTDVASTARFVPGSSQIIFNRPSSVGSVYSAQPITGRALFAIDDTPGASPTAMTIVTPSLVNGQTFTTEDVILGFV